METALKSLNPGFSLSVRAVQLRGQVLSFLAGVKLGRELSQEPQPSPVPNLSSVLGVTHVCLCKPQPSLR